MKLSIIIPALNEAKIRLHSYKDDKIPLCNQESEEI